jgi:hypothetical protein
MSAPEQARRALTVEAPVGAVRGAVQGRVRVFRAFLCVATSGPVALSRATAVSGLHRTPQCVRLRPRADAA